MAKSRAKSIAVADLSKAVRMSVDSALADSKTFRGIKGFDAGVFTGFPHGPIIIGLILREKGLQARSLASFNTLAADIASNIKGAGKPATLFNGKDIIVGYWPGPDILALNF
jgi:hypothetical protein